MHSPAKACSALEFCAYECAKSPMRGWFLCIGTTLATAACEFYFMSRPDPEATWLIFFYQFLWLACFVLEFRLSLRRGAHLYKKGCFWRGACFYEKWCSRRGAVLAFSNLRVVCLLSVFLFVLSAFCLSVLSVCLSGGLTFAIRHDLWPREASIKM